MIKIKLKDALACKEGLTKEHNFKAKVAYQIARIVRGIEAEEELFNKKRDELIQKHYSKDEDGQQLLNDDGYPYVKFGTPEYLELVKELDEIASIEIELNANPINLEDIESAEFTAQDMKAFLPFIKEEDE